jgi:hypothetical protein
LGAYQQCGRGEAGKEISGCGGRGFGFEMFQELADSLLLGLIEFR